MTLEIWTLAYLDKKTGAIEFKHLGQMDSDEVNDLLDSYEKNGVTASAVNHVIMTSLNSTTIKRRYKPT